MPQSKFSSFHPMFTSFAMYAADEDLREVKVGELFSIAAMNDHELRQSIVQDILAPTMWELEKGESVNFDLTEFLRFVPDSGDRQRVLHQMWHDDIKDLILGKLCGNNDNNGQVRIKTDRASMQAAMDYCGVWAHGYDMPEGVIVTNYDDLDNAAETHGGLENLAASLYQDMSASVSGNQTRH
jgi:hypothetical protein